MDGHVGEAWGDLTAGWLFAWAFIGVKTVIGLIYCAGFRDTL